MDIQELRNSEYYKEKLSNKKAKNIVRKFKDKIQEAGITDELIKKGKKLAKYVKRGSLKVKLLAAAALLYFVAPLDLVPDYIPVAGYADDLVVISTVLSEIKSLTKWP